MEAAAAADAGSATTPKRRLRGDRLKPLPVLGLEKERVVPWKKEEGAAQAKSKEHAPAAPAQAPVQAERVCCLLVLDSITSTPQWIRQPKPRGCVFGVCV